MRFIFDAIFPPRANELVIREITKNTMVRKYSPHPHQNIVCLCNYTDPEVKALITENKYHHNSAASKHLAQLLVSWLATQTLPIVLIPIPLSKEREQERGYNQVTAVLRKIDSNKQLSLDEASLQRTRHTTPQTSLQRTERLKNINGAFACNKEKINSYKNCLLVLVDDVATTGATLAGARAVLAPHLHPTSKLICLALAH
jgi:ComF family protein